MLKKAVTHCPRAEMLWLMAAKEKWLENDVEGARIILQEAFHANPDSEQVMYADRGSMPNQQCNYGGGYEESEDVLYPIIYIRF